MRKMTSTLAISLLLLLAILFVNNSTTMTVFADFQAEEVCFLPLAEKYSTPTIIKQQEETKQFPRIEDNRVHSPKVKTSTEKLYSIEDLFYLGVINWSKYKFTFYSERVLPGNLLKIPGRQTSEDGYVKDKDGYIVLASNMQVERGTIVPTPFGSLGKVYDRCEACTLNWFDVYTK